MHPTRRPRGGGSSFPERELARDQWLELDEVSLMSQCEFHPYRSGGPGGQKRNKTSSAVRLVHPPSGMEAISADFRSQSANRVRALHRLRMKMALELRQTVVLQFYQPPPWLARYTPDGKLAVNEKNPDYARVVSLLLDLLEATGGSAPRSAALVGATVGSLLRVFKQDRHALHALNETLRRHGKPV
jgi:hypothetical protein